MIINKQRLQKHLYIYSQIIIIIVLITTNHFESLIIHLKGNLTSKIIIKMNKRAREVEPSEEIQLQ